MFYELTLQVDKLNEKGEEKRVIERYITEDLLFAGTEAKGLHLYKGECDVTAIKRSKIMEVINEKEDEKPFFKAIVYDVFTDDEGNEKETDYYLLVCAKDIKNATEKVLDWMKQGYNMELKSISKTKILDILK